MLKVKLSELYKDSVDVALLNALYNIRFDASVSVNRFGKDRLTRVEQEHWFYEDYANEKERYIFIVYDIKTGNSIGYVDLHVESLIHKRIRFSVALLNKYYDCGYDNDIFTALVEKAQKYCIGVEKFTAFVFAHDKHSIRMLKKQGFEVEACLKKHVVKNGVRKDVYSLCKFIYNELGE